MTFSETNLLRKLKRAQKTPDRDVFINRDTLTAITCGNIHSEKKTVKLKRYKHLLQPILYSLEGKGYIAIRLITETEAYIHVEYAGWCALNTTVRSAIRLTVKDIIVPIVVSVIAAIATTLLIQ